MAYTQLDIHARQELQSRRPMEGGGRPPFPPAPEARGSACPPLSSYLKIAADTGMAECMDLTQRAPRTEASTPTSLSSMSHNPGAQYPLMQALGRDDQEHQQHQQHHGPTLEHLDNVGVIGSAAICVPLLQSDLSSNYNQSDLSSNYNSYLADAAMDHNHTTHGGGEIGRASCRERV